MVDHQLDYTKKQKTRRILRIALFLSFLVSTLAFIISSLIVVPCGADPTAEIIAIVTSVGMVGSCLTSCVTFIAFVSTTVFAWRRDRRETKELELERKRLEVEHEKTRLEVEKLKEERGLTPAAPDQASPGPNRGTLGGEGGSAQKGSTANPPGG